jgi:hypothetical protein
MRITPSDAPARTMLALSLSFSALSVTASESAGAEWFRPPVKRFEFYPEEQAPPAHVADKVISLLRGQHVAPFSL